MIRLGNNEVLKTLTFVDADANANADAGSSTKARPERCSGELKIILHMITFHSSNECTLTFVFEYIYGYVKIPRKCHSHNEAVLTSTHNLGFEQKCEKYPNFYRKNLEFFGGEISNIFV